MIVSQINIYPIKSCGGITLDSAEIDARGLVNDRRWLLVDEDWHFFTQREIAQMAQIKPAVDADCLRLSAPEMGTFELPVDQAGRRVEVTVWQESGIGAVDQGDEVAEWMSSFLKRKCRLVRYADDFVRQANQEYAPRPTDQLGFADGYPFLVISEESLADLNTRLAEPLPMNRFRPNIVVRGADDAYAEDGWKVFRVGEVTFDVVKPCARCVVTTTDQATAKRAKEPLRTLATYRPSKNGPLFGQNVVHQNTGTIRTGTSVEVVEYQYH